MEKDDAQEGPSVPKIIKTEDGENVQIKLEFAMTTKHKNDQHTSSTSVSEMDKNTNLSRAIVRISPDEKLNAKDFESKGKSLYFEGVKQTRQSS